MMNDARLWRRILHEGISGPLGDSVDAVLSAPIIIDSMPPSHYEGKMDWPKYGPLTIPFVRFYMEFQPSLMGAVAGAIVESRQDSHGWDVGMGVISGLPGLRPHTNCAMRFRLRNDGRLDLADNGGLPVQITTFVKLTDLEKQLFYDASLCHISNMADVLELLGCNNVGLELRDNDPKQVRIAAKRYGPTAHGYRYHVLVVRPAGARSDSPSQEIGNIPRHICRGHFAEYGPQYGKGLLFGKHEGRFYIPPHMKGDAKNGTVYKDYEVRP